MSLVSFCSLVLVVAVSCWQGSALKWTNCGEKESPVKVTTLRLKPNPIIVEQGKEVRFSGSVEVKGKVGSTYKLKTEVVKNPGYWYAMTLGCYGSFGTCEYTDLKCEQMLPFLKVPSCPPPKGTYELKERRMTIPHLSIPSFLTNGLYSIKAEVFDQRTDELLACAEVEVTATS
ncbi:ganglioside GM2 activator [Nematostella vectensis]|uniref:ganglioside GM2 activator n=1 Tax=Nematostella vectensis TaxID=45351 RepID=UPI00207751CA|nr:ganglioside GM2 activator [Nematostella vectensis]